MRATRNYRHLPTVGSLAIPSVTVLAVSLFTFAPVNAVAVTDVVTKPVTTVTDLLDRTPSTPSITVRPDSESATTQPSSEPEQSQSSQSEPTSETPTDSQVIQQISGQSVTPSSTTTGATPRQSADSGSVVSASNLSAVIYPSGQLNRSAAMTLYKIAAATALAGFVLYALTTVHRNNPTHRGSLWGRVTGLASKTGR